MSESYENREYVYYCPKCGDVCYVEYDFDGKCIICGHQMFETPHEYELSKSHENELMKLGWKENKHIWEECEQRLFDEVISKSPEFDIDLYNKKDSINEQQYQKFIEGIAHGKAILNGTDKGNPYGVKCPYCNATNVKKLGILSRSASIGFFGLGSGKIGKQWHCTHCGSDF